MEDEKGRYLVSRISLLWRQQRGRELIYLGALRKDGMGSLRKVLSQAHFSAILFQKEIHWIYDYFKCFLNDSDLSSNTTEIDNNQDLEDLEELVDQQQIVKFLKRKEEAIINNYKALYNFIDRDYETKRMLKEHLDRLSEFYEVLSKQEKITVKVGKKLAYS